MKGQRIGYTRVSTLDQCLDRQLIGVELDKVFSEKASAKTAERPELQAMLTYAREGDHIFVHSLDRLARNLVDLVTIVNDCVSKGIKITFLKENLEFGDKSNPMHTLMLHVFGAIGEFERSLIKERQREGIALARQKNKYTGRKPSLSQEQLPTILEMRSLGVPLIRIARKLKVAENTLRTFLKKTSPQAPESTIPLPSIPTYQ